jgi:CBS domain-containing protein
MNARQIMTPNPVTVGPGSTIAEVARLLVEHRISGLPVVNGNSEVLGIVTQTDLFLKQKRVPFSMTSAPVLFDEWADPQQLPEQFHAAEGKTVEEIMTRDVICADVDSEVGALASLMMEHHVKRIPILENGKLAGIVTRHDLIQHMAGK